MSHLLSREYGLPKKRIKRIQTVSPFPSCELTVDTPRSINSGNIKPTVDTDRRCQLPHQRVHHGYLVL